MMETSRKYGGLISLVSGIYSLYLGMQTASMASMWLMNLLGLVVIGHGALLLLDAELDFLNRSGELMIVYSTVMLANQAWMYSMMLDPGMVATAVIMLGSGVIMYRENSM